MSRVIDTEVRYIPPPAPEISPGDYEDRCCVPGGSVPCETTYRPFYGYQQQEILDRLGYPDGVDENGNVVEIRFIEGNSSGICGEEETRMVGSENCCDFYAPVEWDYAASADVIADNSSGKVYVTGGKPPYEWTISGSNFSLADNTTDIPENTVITGDACGSADITCSDECDTSCEGSVRSPDGSWVKIYHSEAGVEGESITPVAPFTGGCFGEFSGTAANGATSASESDTQGKYKIDQSFDRVQVTPVAKSSYAEAVAWCVTVDPESYVTDPERLEGACFVWDGNCHVCGECSHDQYTSPYASFGHDPGKLSSITEDEGQTWFYAIIWIREVTSTDIWEWQC